MSDIDDLLQDRLDDPSFRSEWEALRPQRILSSAMIKARTDAGLSIGELAKAAGTGAGVIKRIERGEYNPSWKLLNRIAAGMGKQVHIEFR